MEKRVMTLDELCEYSGYAKSYLYKKTMDGLIPGAHKPGGKKIFFDRIKIDQWLLGDPSIAAAQAEALEQKEIAASTYVTTH